MRGRSAAIRVASCAAPTIASCAWAQAQEAIVGAAQEATRMAADLPRIRSEMWPGRRRRAPARPVGPERLCRVSPRTGDAGRVRGRDGHGMAAPGGAPASAGGGAAAGPQPLAVMRSRAYLRLLVLAAVLGVPIAAAAFVFLKVTDLLHQWTFSQLPSALGFTSAPI